MSKAKKAFYGLEWPEIMPQLEIERSMIVNGGQWKSKRTGRIIGNGLFFHFKQLQSLLWPDKVWHRWNELLLEEFTKNCITGVLGPAASGKTREASDFVLTDYYCFSDQTTVLVSSTEREMLEMRAWGEIKRAHKSAKERFPWLPGELIESRQRIVTDSKDEEVDGRDFRNGIVGVPCKKGGNFVGLGCVIGGTLIDTPSGPRPIETIRNGDFVLNAVGFSKVKQCSRRLTDTVLNVRTRDGRSFGITPEHPVLTQMGWVKAIDLRQCHYIHSANETMQILQRSNHHTRSEYLLQQVLLLEMEDERSRLQDEILHSGQSGQDQCDKAEDAQRQARACGAGPTTAVDIEPYEERVHKEAGKRDNETAWLQADHPWRKRHRPNSGRENPAISFQRRQVELCYSHQSGIRKRFSILLQGGHRISFGDVGNRGRRHIARDITCQMQRREKDHLSSGSWVESVKITESGHHSKNNGSSCVSEVFNLSVEGHPSYSVNGLIVHNSYAGIHNKRVRLLADEGQFMPAAYVDAISNLKKTKDFKGIVIGNPKDTTDALGKICEPSAELGGWDSGVDQGGMTKTWPIRFPDSQCVQLVGSDSPNLDGSLNIGLITQEQINADIQFYGKDSLQFTMMDEGRMPRGQASRRVLTRAMCIKFKAMEPPVWKMPDRTKIGFLDAAYRGVGGDRCVFGQLDMGIGLDEEGKEFHMLALVDTMVVPIKGNITEEPEDQIVNFVVPLCNDRGITPEHMFFDSTGRGSLMGAFARLWSPNVQCVEFGGKPTERVVSNEIRVSCRDYYSKFVSELWFSVRLVIESGQFRGLTEDLLQEGCSREWTMIASNKIEVEPKDKTKIRMGRSPDLFDGLVAGVEGARRLGFLISKLSKGVVSEASEKWKEELRARAAKLSQRGALNYAA